MESLMGRAALICATLVFSGIGSPAAAQQQSTPESSQQSVPPAPPPDLRGATAPASETPTHRWVNTGGYLTPAPRRTTAARSSPKHQAKPAPGRSSKARAASKREDRSAKSMTQAELKNCKALSHRQLRHNSKCQTALRERSKPAAREAGSAKALSKSELRHCKSLSPRQLRRNAKSQAALRPEPKSIRTKDRPAKTLSKAELRRCQAMSYRQLLRNDACAAQLQREIRAGSQGNHHAGSKAAVRKKKAPAPKDRRVRQSAKRHRA